MNRLIFALCWRVFHHARWIPYRWDTGTHGRRCLCAHHFYYPPYKKLP